MSEPIVWGVDASACVDGEWVKEYRGWNTGVHYVTPLGEGEHEITVRVTDSRNRDVAARMVRASMRAEGER